MATAHKFLSNKSNSAKSALQHMKSAPALNSPIADIIKMIIAPATSETKEVEESGGTSSYGKSN